MNQDHWEHKYYKYKLKYQQLLELANSQQGGAGDKKEDDKPKKAAKADKPKADKGEKKEDDRPSMRVGCVNIVQEKEDLHFEGRICKTPAIRVKVSDADVKIAKVVKILLRFVNKRLRMSDVKSVEVVKGKKKTEYAGDKLDATINVEKMAEIDEVNVQMN